MGSGQESRGAVDVTPPSVGTRPEVLLEAPEGADTGALWGLLADAGYRVSWCPGPSGAAPSWCPLLGGHRCALVESADVVLCALGFSDASCRQVLEGLRRLHPDTPVIVETPMSQAVRWESLLQGHPVLPMPPSSRAVIEDVEAALSRRGAERETTSR